MKKPAEVRPPMDCFFRDPNKNKIKNAHVSSPAGMTEARVLKLLYAELNMMKWKKTYDILSHLI